MSPTTLYREGSDLDELLAELDTRFPGQVRVVEVTRPREGGVLGFFAKERVGVHYRLVAAGAAEAPAPTREPSPAQRGRLQAPDPVVDTVAGVRSKITNAYDADRVAGSADPVRGAVARDGFGPDPAALRAALAQRAIADARAAAEAGTADAGAEAGAAEPACAPKPVAAPPAVGMEFAQILANIALRKSTGTGPGAERPAAAFAAAEFVPLGVASPAPAETSTTATAVETTRVEALAAELAVELAAAMTATAAAAPEAAERDVLATETAESLEAAPARRTPRAVPIFKPPSAKAGAEADFQPAFTSLPHVSTQDDSLLPVAGLASGVNDLTGAAADELTREAAITPPSASARPGPLSWPLATNTAALASPQQNQQHAVAGTAATGGATALLARQEGAGAVQDAAEDAAAHSAVTNRPVTRGLSMRETTYSMGGAAASGPSTPLTLRRQMLELGVPVDQVPTDAVHAYAAVETLVRSMPAAPELPAEPGQILVVAGPARDVVTAAEAIVTGHPGLFEKTWSFGCPAALETRRVSTTAHAITSPRHAEEVAADARKSTTGPTLIVIATDTTPHHTASDISAALAADAVWAAVDATRKPADTRAAMHKLGDADALIVANAEHSSSPATVWELGLPIALVDGRPSTEPTWAVLLLGKLSELEESACSSALC